MFSWRRKAPRERRRRKHLGGSGGKIPHEIFKIEYSETPFPAFLEPRKQFPRQCWRSLKFSLKSKLLNENGQLVGGGGGRMATTEFSLAYHCEFIWFSKKMFGNLGCSPFIKSVGYSSRSEPKAESSLSVSQSTSQSPRAAVAISTSCERKKWIATE